MKTKCLFIAALFIAGSAISQTASVNNSASSQASVTAAKQASASSALSSNTTANATTNAAAKMKTAEQTASEVKEAGESRVETTKGEIKTDYQNGKHEIESDRSVSADIHAGSGARMESEYNKTGSNTSINTAGKVSAENSSASAVNTLENVEITGKNAAKASVNRADDLKMKANAKTSANASNVVKVKAANQRLNTGVKSSIGSHSAVITR